MIAVFLEFVATKSFLTLRAFLDVGTSNKAGSVLPAKFRIVAQISCLGKIFGLQ